MERIIAYTVVKQPEDKRRRQQAFLEALGTLADFQIHYGHFLADTITCRNCGHTYATHHEKMTDVNISVKLMTDAFQDNFDAALLVSADSDLIAPIRATRNIFRQKRVVVAFPPGRSSLALKQTASGVVYIGRDTLAKSVFPDHVIKADGFVLHRPTEWR